MAQLNVTVDEAFKSEVDALAQRQQLTSAELARRLLRAACDADARGEALSLQSADAGELVGELKQLGSELQRLVKDADRRAKAELERERQAQVDELAERHQLISRMRVELEAVTEPVARGFRAEVEARKSDRQALEKLVALLQSVWLELDASPLTVPKLFFALVIGIVLLGIATFVAVNVAMPKELPCPPSITTRCVIGTPACDFADPPQVGPHKRRHGR